MQRLVFTAGVLKKYKIIVVAFFAFLLFARAVRAQTPAPCSTCNVVDNGSNPPCPGGASMLRIRAACDAAPLMVTVRDAAATVRASQTVGLTTLEMEQGLPPGIYRVSLSCASTDRGDYEISVQAPTPTATISRQGSSVSVGTLCNTPGLILNLTATPYSNATVAWSGPGTIADPSAASTTLTNIPEGNQTYTYTVSKAGCNDLIATAPLRVINTPPPPNPVANIEACAGDNVGPINFSVNNPSGSGPISFNWRNNRTSIGLGQQGSGNIPAFTASNTQAGTAEAEVSVSAATNGCSSDPIKFKISIYPQISAQFLSNKATYCAGEDITLEVRTNIGEKFSWSGPASFSQETTGNTRSVTIRSSTVQNAGPYSVTVDVGSPGGCQRTLPLSVNVIQGPVFKVVTPQTVCDNNYQGFDLTAPAVTQGSDAGLQYSYWYDEAATSGIANPDRIPVAGGTFYIRNVGAGCIITKPVVVTPVPAPVINVLNPPAVCQDDPRLPLNLASTILLSSSPAGVVYSYFKGDRSPITANPPKVNDKGTNTYYIRGVNPANGCTATAQVTVKINAAPNITLASPPAICNDPASARRVNLADLSLITDGTESVDTPDTAREYPYTYWKDRLCTMPAETATLGVPAPGKAKLTSPSAWEFSVPLDFTIPPAETIKIYDYYVKAKKTYNDPAPANECTSVSQVSVIVSQAPTVANSAARPYLCGTEKKFLTDCVIPTPSTATLQFFDSNTPSRRVIDGTKRAGAGTYYAQGNLHGCLSPLFPFTLPQFPNPTLDLTDLSVCYDPSNVANTYSLLGMVTAFDGDYPALQFLKTNTAIPLDDPNNLYANQALTLSSAPAPTEVNTGVANKEIWVQGAKTYTINNNATRTCTTLKSAKFTVKPLPSVKIDIAKYPGHRHDFLCNGGKTRILPEDDNEGKYDPRNPSKAAYTWTAQECDQNGVVPNPQPPGIVTGETSQGIPQTPAPFIVQTLSLPAGTAGNFGYVRYEFTATLNGCTSLNTDYIIVPVVSVPAPVVPSGQFNMCGGTVSNGAPTKTNIPLQVAANSPQPPTLFFNWRVNAVIANDRTFVDVSRLGNTKKPPDLTIARLTNPPSLIEDELINPTDHDLTVTYDISPLLPVADEAGRPSYCVGNSGRTTVVVHPVPQLNAGNRDITACNGGKVNTTLGSTVNGTKYYWEIDPPPPAGTAPVRGILQYKPDNNGAPQDYTVFRDQELRMLDPLNPPTADIQFKFKVTPNYAYSPTFIGCSGNSASDFAVTFHKHGYPVLNPLTQNEPSQDICADFVNDADTKQNVTISLSSTVEGATPIPPASDIAYSWTIGGDYSRNGNPSGNFINGFTNGDLAKGAAPQTINATLYLAVGNNPQEIAARQTTDRAIYYDISATYNGCTGPSFRVPITLHPAPVVTEVNAGGVTKVCNGAEVRINVQSSYAPNNPNTMYQWNVPPKSAANPDNPVGLTSGGGDSQDTNWPNIRISFTDKDKGTRDVNVNVIQRRTIPNTTINCQSRPHSVTITMLPEPDAEVKGNLGICLNDRCVLRFTSPNKLPNVLYKWKPTAPYELVVDPPNKYADYDNAPPAAGPITDNWKLRDDHSFISKAFPVSYEITPYLEGCKGSVILAEVTVYPIIKTAQASLVVPANPPPLPPPPPDKVCSGSDVVINLLPNPPVEGTKFKWEAVFPNIVQGISSEPFGIERRTIQQTAYNRGTAPEEVTYKITPILKFTEPDAECVGSEFIQRLTIYPAPQLTNFAATPSLVCSGEGGNLVFSNNLNDPNAHPVYYSWTTSQLDNRISGQSSSTGDMLGNAGESRYAYGPLTNSIGSEQGIVFLGSIKTKYRYPADPALPPQFELVCAGDSKSASVRVAPTPSMIEPPPAAVCNGDNVSVSLRDDNNNLGTFFTWAIGASNNVDTGGIPVPAADEESLGPISGALSLSDPARGGSVSLTITPRLKSSASLICNAADTKTITIQVFPVPALDPIPPVKVCSQDKVEITFPSSSLPNTSYAWSNDNINTGLAESGLATSSAATQTSSIAPFSAVLNEANRDLVSNITIIPSADNAVPPSSLARLACIGQPQRVTLTVLSAPAVQAVIDGEKRNICGGGKPEITLVTANGMSGTLYTWTAVSANVAGATPQTTPVSSFASAELTPTTPRPGTVVYTFRGTGDNGCIGEPEQPSTTITVSPVPQAEAQISPLNKKVCPGGDKAVISLRGVSGRTPDSYSWDVSDVTNAEGYVSSPKDKQNVTQISDNLTLPDPNLEGKLSYKITPWINGCAGPEFRADLILSPKLKAPAVNPDNQDFCPGRNVTLSTASSNDVLFRWYLSTEEGRDGTWQLLENSDPYSGADSKDLVINNISAKFHNRVFKAELIDVNCPNSKVESATARLTELLYGASVSALPSATLLAGNSVSYTCTIPEEGVTYLWDFGDGWKSRARNPAHFYYDKGIFKTHLLIKKGDCEKDLYPSPIVVSGPDDYGDIVTEDRPFDKEGVSAYPVPVKDLLTIETKDDISMVEVRSSQGVVVSSEKASGKKALVPMSELAAGIYVLTITHESGVSIVKVVKY